MTTREVKVKLFFAKEDIKAIRISYKCDKPNCFYCKTMSKK
jgi:hypothetical protein